MARFSKLQIVLVMFIVIENSMARWYANAKKDEYIKWGNGYVMYTDDGNKYFNKNKTGKKNKEIVKCR